MRHLKKFNEHKDSIEYNKKLELDLMFNNPKSHDVIKFIDNPKYFEEKLKAGLDPNFNNSLPMRAACRGTWESRDKYGEGYFDSFKLLIKNGAKVTDVRGRNVVVKWAAEYGRIDFIDYMIENNLVNSDGIKDALNWAPHSRKIPADKMDEVVEYLNRKLDKI